MFFLEQSREQGSTRPFDLRDRGLLLADGIFDTSLIVQGDMILREAHVDRLIADATALGIVISRQKINNLIDQTLTEDHHGVLRITVTSGPAERWGMNTQRIQPTVLLNFSALNVKYESRPISLQVTSIQRNSTSITSRHKTLAYTDNIAAFRAARDEGYDDALFLNNCGNICCTTTGNIFLNFGKYWATAPTSEGVLPGVMRQWVMEIASSIGIELKVMRIPEINLKFVESAFITNSVRLVTPISKINELELQPQLPTGLEHNVMKLIEVK